MEEEKSKVLGWAQFGGTVFLGVVGLIFTYSFNRSQAEFNRLQEVNRQTMAYMQLMSARDQSETDFRERVFAYLGEKLLDARVPLGNRLAILRLFEENFSNAFNVRLFFDAMEIEAEKRPKNERVRLVSDLHSIARRVKGEQETLLGVKANKRTLERGKPDTVVLGFDELHPHHEDGHKKNGHKIDITVLDVSSRRVTARVAVDDAEAVEYEVSYFDEPLTDNTLLGDGHRFALTLEDLDPANQRATLNFLEFPSHYAVYGDRPTFEEVIKRLSDLDSQAH